VIIYTMPMWAALFATWLLGERLNAWRVGALVSGLVGLAVLLSQDLSALRNAPLGAAMNLVAAVSFGLGPVWMKRRAWDMDTTVIGGWQLVIGVIPVAVIWALFSPPTVWAGVSPESWLAVAFIGLIANALGYFAWFRVVAMFSATATGIASMAVPIVGVFASALLIGEVVGWRELAALALICLALALNVASAARARAPT
jgi:drug/metabolite transporter (DMT)-like permease